MSPVFQELWTSCVTKHTKTPMNWQTVADEFAKSILKECVSCCNWVGTVNQHPVEPVHTARAINKRIKQHFGVTDENL